MKYDILLFDADDTLFDFYHTGQTSFLKACKTVGLNATEKDYDVYSAINQKRWDLYSLGKITKEDVLLGRFEEYARVKKIDLDVRKFYELYEQNLSETAILYPETEKMLALLKKAVILPHHKAASPVGAVKVFLALVNRRAATGTSADCFPLRGKQLRFILGNRGIGLDKPRCHFLNPAHEVGGAVAALCNPGKARFPFCRKLRGRKAVGQNSDKVIPVLCGD